MKRLVLAFFFLGACGGSPERTPLDLDGYVAVDMASPPDLAQPPAPPDFAQPDPCDDVACPLPSEPTCLDTLTLVLPTSASYCYEGECNYVNTTTCPYGCDKGACLAQCHAGTEDACTASGMQWDGTQCCSTLAPLQCVAGDATSCVGTARHWTGSLCCVEENTCIAGTAQDCPTLGYWTGSLCCTSYGADQCLTDVTPGFCANDNGKWSGAACCGF